MKILFVGQNPARDDQKGPFQGTRSLIMLNRWIEQVGLLGDDEIYLSNAHGEVGKLPPPKEANMMDHVVWHAARSNVVVALGDYASRALEIRNIRHLKMPHPSGMNRKLNDKLYMQCMLNLLKVVVNAAREIEDQNG